MAGMLPCISSNKSGYLLINSVLLIFFDEGFERRRFRTHVISPPVISICKEVRSACDLLIVFSSPVANTCLYRVAF
jgi:hypothetical protein